MQAWIIGLKTSDDDDEINKLKNLQQNTKNGMRIVSQDKIRYLFNYTMSKRIMFTTSQGKWHLNKSYRAYKAYIQLIQLQKQLQKKQKEQKKSLQNLQC